jgi:UDP-glucose 4-epimerase
MKKHNILITGGAGAIGSRMAYKLYKNNNVSVVDDLSSGYISNLPKEVRFIEGDVSDGLFIKRLFDQNKFDYIYHFAALFANQNSIDHPEKDLQVNGDGTLKLILASLPQAKAGILKRFVFASSSCVYGMADGVLDEESKFSPDTPYAITKIIGERYLNFYHENEKFPITILRFFNSYGPGERPGQYRNVVPNFIKLALDNKPLTITGTGDESRDFTFVDDVIDCIHRSALDNESNGEVFNVASGKETKIRKLAELIVELCESKSEIIYKERRSWDNVTSRCGSITKAYGLGYVPKTELKEGLKHTIAWIQSL